MQQTLKSDIRFSQPSSDIKGSWLLPPITERAGLLPAFPKAGGSAALPRAHAHGQKPPDEAEMPKFPAAPAGARLTLLGARLAATWLSPWAVGAK